MNPNGDNSFSGDEQLKKCKGRVYSINKMPTQALNIIVIGSINKRFLFQK